MKRLLLLLVLSVFSTSIFAQLSKGQWLVGGSAGFSYVDEHYSLVNIDHDKSTTIQLAPAIGYFIIDKLCLGLRAGLGFTHYNNTDSLFAGVVNSKSNLNSYSVSPFLRYYFLPKTNRINLLADVGYEYFYSKSKQWQNGIYSGTSTEKWHSYTLAAGPVFFINPKTAIEVTAAYTFQNEGLYYVKTNTLMLNVGFQIYLGK